MGWSLGWDGARWIGYGVVAYCDYPYCENVIDRGLGYRCNNPDWDTDDRDACGGFFCSDHRAYDMCQDCEDGDMSWAVDDTREHPLWLDHILGHNSWKKWRQDPENAEVIARYRKQLADNPYIPEVHGERELPDIVAE